MSSKNRRSFMSDVGRSMLTVGLGTSVAFDLGLSPTFASEGSSSIPLGEYERLVELMRNLPADKLQPVLAERLTKGETDLKQLVSAGALANAVTFGGCDYVGFHTAMAMLPALEMSRQLDAKRSALPILKVLYRNSQQIQKVGGASTTVLQSLDAAEAAEHAGHEKMAERIRDACRQPNVELGEHLLTSIGDSPLDAFNALQLAMQDDANVHRYVFAHRTYGLVGLLGKEYAHALLRQCVRFCANHEQERINRKLPESPMRKLIPRLLDQYKLAGKKPGTRNLDDSALEQLCETIYLGPGAQSAEAVAAAIADGVATEVVGEAISLASNLNVLRQGDENWRTHGDSVGVHTSDSTNAWRNMARIAETSHAVSGLLVAAYYSCGQGNAKYKPFETPAYPTTDHRALFKNRTAEHLLAEAEDAIRHNDQGRAAAAIQIYGEHGYAVGPVFELMLQYAVSEDGRLHGEKYYHTVREEYRTIRPAFRWRQVVGLARVTASAYGYNRVDQHGFRAAGYEEACKLLGVEV